MNNKPECVYGSTVCKCPISSQTIKYRYKFKSNQKKVSSKILVWAPPKVCTKFGVYSTSLSYITSWIAEKAILILSSLRGIMWNYMLAHVPEYVLIFQKFCEQVLKSAIFFGTILNPISIIITKLVPNIVLVKTVIYTFYWSLKVIIFTSYGIAKS